MDANALDILRVDADTETRVGRLTARTGWEKTFYARAAIEAHLDDA